MVRIVSSRKVTTSGFIPNDNTTRNNILLCLCGLSLLVLLLLLGNIAKSFFPNLWSLHLQRNINRALALELDKLIFQPSIFLKNICMITRISRGTRHIKLS